MNNGLYYKNKEIEYELYDVKISKNQYWGSFNGYLIILPNINVDFKGAILYGKDTNFENLVPLQEFHFKKYFFYSQKDVSGIDEKIILRLKAVIMIYYHISLNCFFGDKAYIILPKIKKLFYKPIVKRVNKNYQVKQGEYLLLISKIIQEYLSCFA